MNWEVGDVVAQCKMGEDRTIRRTITRVMKRFVETGEDRWTHDGCRYPRSDYRTDYIERPCEGDERRWEREDLEVDVIRRVNGTVKSLSKESLEKILKICLS